MARVPTGIVAICHVIFWQCDMKASNYYYDFWGWRDRVATRAAILALLFGILPLLLATAAAFAAPVGTRHDSILAGPAAGPCAGASSGADYVGGTDAYGRPVPTADVAGAPVVQLDSETVYADVRAGRHDGMANVAVDVKGLGRAMAAPSGCSPER